MTTSPDSDRGDRGGASTGLDPQNPTDTSPLEVAGHSGAGTAAFAVRSGARLQCGTCGTTSRADQQRADDVARSEGVSDPDDMTITFAVTCPACGAEGLLTLGYGPEADADAADFISAVPRDPRSGRTS